MLATRKIERNTFHITPSEVVAEFSYFTESLKVTRDKSSSWNGTQFRPWCAHLSTYIFVAFSGV